MTGSGNDFVFFDGRIVSASVVTQPDVVKAICNRHNGIGADGVVVLEPGSQGRATSGSPGSASAPQATILYFNSDGTPADLCGNATLCSTALSVALGLGPSDGMGLLTPSGRIEARIVNGLPEIRLQPVQRVDIDSEVELAAGEIRVGFAVVGIPHLVVFCDDADAVDLAQRGPLLRRHSAGGPTGANVNWVSARPDGSWRYRTFERGVEGETLACGTGAVATAVLLNAWGLAGRHADIVSSSGRTLSVSLSDAGSEPGLIPALRGEGRVVFSGTISDLGNQT